MRIDFGQTKTNRDRSSVRAIRPSGGIFCPCRLLRAYLKKLPGDDTWLLLPNTEAGYLVPYSISHGGAWKAFRKLSSGPTSTRRMSAGEWACAPPWWRRICLYRTAGIKADSLRVRRCRIVLTSANKKLAKRTSAVFTLEPGT